jgi:hypothetical protein
LDSGTASPSDTTGLSGSTEYTADSDGVLQCAAKSSDNEDTGHRIFSHGNFGLGVFIYGETKIK